MSGFNYSDMDDQETSELSSAAEQVLLEELSQRPSAEIQGTVRDKAIKQMEHANLYRVLLENNLFAPGSARPEIQQLVEEEIKTFIESRLVELLNIGSQPVQKNSSIQDIFSENEVSALKVLATRIAGKMPEAAPTAAVEVAPTPKLKQVDLRSAQTVPALKTAAAKPTKSTAPSKTPSLSKPISSMTPEEAKEELRRRNDAASSSKQAAPKQPKARSRMPSLAEQEQKILQDMQYLNNDPLISTIIKAGR